MQALIGKSFITEVFIVTPCLEGSIAITQGDILKEGWLIHGGETLQSLSLRFDYLEHSDDRILFDITGGPGAGKYAGAKLGRSLAGFLGFYREATVTDFWKMQVVWHAESTGRVDFILRDHEGYRVSLCKIGRKPAGMMPGRYDGGPEKWLRAGNNDGLVLQFSATVNDFLAKE